jgi:hypothetical protein
MAITSCSFHEFLRQTSAIEKLFSQCVQVAQDMEVVVKSTRMKEYAHLSLLIVTVKIVLT